MQRLLASCLSRNRTMWVDILSVVSCDHLSWSMDLRTQWQFLKLTESCSPAQQASQTECAFSPYIYVLFVCMCTCLVYIPWFPSFHIYACHQFSTIVLYFGCYFLTKCALLPHLCHTSTHFIYGQLLHPSRCSSTLDIGQAEQLHHTMLHIIYIM